MDETFKRRLIGAGLLLLAAFLLASMLPEPRLRKARDPGQNVVTIELQEPEAVATQDVASMMVNPMPNPIAVPAATPATDSATDASADPQVDEATDSPGDSGEAETPPDIESGDRSTLVAPTPAITPRPSPRPSARPVEQAAVQTPAPSAAPTSTPVRVAVASPSTTPVPAATPVPTPAAAAGAGTRWWIQIGSYSDITNARIVETRMRAIGQAVVIAPIDTRSGVLYRVRCGPYASQAAGQEVHARVVTAGYPEARLVNP